MSEVAGNFTIVDLCGAIHLHTQFSDGTASCAEMVATAQQVGLDFILVTDHMTLKAREEGFDGFHGSLLVSIGYEHNDIANRNHYLAFGVDTVANAIDRPQEYIDEIKKGGGIGFLAHPCEKRHYFSHLPPYPWTAWDVERFDGFEIWNQMSDWVEHFKTYFSIIRFFYPRRFLFGISSELLQRWDMGNRTRFIAGLGGVDAHARLITWGPLRFKVFPLKVELKAIRTHLYLEQKLDRMPFDEARKKLLAALRDGRSFVSNYRWGDARGSRFILEEADGTRTLPGRKNETTALPATLEVSLPLSGRIHLLKNGVLLETVHAKEHRFTIDSFGVYRVEVYRKRRAWIYSNPFPVGSYPY